jgi:Mg2+/Co2+ transporter CorB
MSLILYAGLVTMSAFFAGAETALTGASRPRMTAMEDDGNKRAALVNRMREKKEMLIGGLLLGNTLSHVAASALAASVMIGLFGTKGVVYATFITSTMLLIFGEVVPKTYAMIHADRMSLSISPAINFFIRVCYPVLYAVEHSVHWTFRIFGISHPMQTENHEEELRGAIALLEETNDTGMEQEKSAMLRSILDLADVKVEEIMVHRRNVRMVNADWPVQKIVDEVLHSTLTRLPVWRGTPDNIVGVVHARLLLSEMRRCGGELSRINIANAMMEPWFIPDSATLFEQLQEFRRRHEHFAVMVDEYGALKGVVTLEDILEEIVGEIDDEHDKSVSGVHAQLDGSFVVDGKVTIRDLNREFDWKLPDEDYSTLAGLLLHETQRIPGVGQTFTFFGFLFEVLKRQRNQITSIRITPAPKESPVSEENPPHAAQG